LGWYSGVEAEVEVEAKANGEERLWLYEDWGWRCAGRAERDPPGALVLYDGMLGFASPFAPTSWKNSSSCLNTR
jgi:hypothetical protein